MPPRKASRSTNAPSSSSSTRQYLILYNAASFLLWAPLLLRVTSIATQQGLSKVYPSVGTFTRNTQTLAVAEILHSLIGLVRAPIATTALQVASRLQLVWGIVHLFASGLGLGASGGGRGAVENQIAYTGMLGAWSATETVRYAYFAIFLYYGGNAASVPGFLTWARYNLFFVLYPMGISCEVWLVYQSLPMAETVLPAYKWFLVVGLAAYVPG